MELAGIDRTITVIGEVDTNGIIQDVTITGAKVVIEKSEDQSGLYILHIGQDGQVPPIAQWKVAGWSVSLAYSDLSDLDRHRGYDHQVQYAPNPFDGVFQVAFYDMEGDPAVLHDNDKFSVIIHFAYLDPRNILVPLFTRT